jgi:hypothetical protein
VHAQGWVKRRDLGGRRALHGRYPAIARLRQVRTLLRLRRQYVVAFVRAARIGAGRGVVARRAGRAVLEWLRAFWATARGRSELRKGKIKAHLAQF